MRVYSILTQFIMFVLSELQSVFFLIYIKACVVMSATIETLVCKHKCTSNVWSYFGFVPKSDDHNQPKDPNEVICKICFKKTGSLPKPVCIADSNTLKLFPFSCTPYRSVFTVESSHGISQTKHNNIAMQGNTIKTAAKDGCFCENQYVFPQIQ